MAEPSKGLALLFMLRSLVTNLLFDQDQQKKCSAFGLLFKFQQKRWGLQKMVLGFTMIKVLRGQEDEAYLALKNTNGVKEVYRILGEYSLFVIMQAENNIMLHRLIDEIKNVSSVLSIWHVLVSHKDIPSNAKMNYGAKRMEESMSPLAEILISCSKHA